MSTSCRENGRLLGIFFDGQLDAVKTLDVEEHVASCEACRDRIELDRAIRASLKKAVADAAAPKSDDFKARMMAAMMAEDERLRAISEELEADDEAPASEAPVSAPAQDADVLVLAPRPGKTARRSGVSYRPLVPLAAAESGTGQELVAKAIHEASPRADNRFVAVNCSNIPSELLESELFGHTKGAFTGAVAAKKGLFEVADSGSIFLDEIGDLRPEMQVRLLRVIQEREFTPIGDTTPKVDVRIFAATNVDLKEAVKAGPFREDLYFRLSVVPIELPPLRQRKEDILPLAQHFVRKYNAENGRSVSDTFSPEVLSLLENYYYPGNVRELENVIERAVVIAATDEITVDCLRPEVRDPSLAFDLVKRSEGTSSEIDIARGVNFYEDVKRFEIDLIRRALDQTAGHQSRAAQLLGLNATTLNSKIKSYNIVPRANH